MTVYAAMKTEGTTAIPDLASLRQATIVSFPAFYSAIFYLHYLHCYAALGAKAVTIPATRLRIIRG